MGATERCEGGHEAERTRSGSISQTAIHGVRNLRWDSFSFQVPMRDLVLLRDPFRKVYGNCRTTSPTK
jgi:hypothetical protein